MTAVAIQSRNDNLERRSARRVLKCLEAVVRSGLVKTFEHQGKTYLYQPDWQDWQKVRWPARTINPRPPLDAATPATRLLFEVFPGGSKVPLKSSRSTSGVLPPTREVANGTRLTANGNGSPQAPLVARRRKDAAFEGERVYVPQRIHSDFLTFGRSEAELYAFYEAVSAAWAGPRKHDEVGADMFAFWRDRYNERWPKAAAKRERWAKPAGVA